jgi:hypothetical protein
MIVAFNISNLSQMRYFGPILELLGDEQDFQIILCVFRYGEKYQRLTTDINYNKFKEIITTIVPDAKIILMKDSNSNFDRKGSKVKCDVLFTSEISDLEYFEFKKHYAIQHGFDYIWLGHRAIPKTVYLTHSKVYGLDLQRKHKIKFLVPPVPVAFSNIKKQIQFAKNQINTDKNIAFLFFPEKGLIRLTQKIIKYLKNKDFFVIVKQRRKNQLVPVKIGADLIVYDDIWYPSESIFYPLISKIVIGFSSSAHTDLCEIGINYIDNATLKHYRKDQNIHSKDNIPSSKIKPPIYLKPNVNNYWFVVKKFYKNTINLIDQISSEEYNIKIISEDKIKDFYIKLL